MNPSDNSDDDERDSVYNQILEYYKKFSQSRELPKYFSGTSISYMPEIVPKEDLDDSQNLPVIAVEQYREPQEMKLLSPASSVASNRKLEWDNGADIGYANCGAKAKVHRSMSLPNLSRDASQKNQVINLISDSSHSDLKEQSSSVSDPKVQPISQVDSSSSSDAAERVNDTITPSIVSKANSAQPSSDSSSTNFVSALAYLKSKIGSPDAESTPKAPYSETPVLAKPTNRRKSKIITLCITKPITVTCLDNAKQSGSNKKIQTSASKNVSKCVQTGSSLNSIPIIQENAARVQGNNQSILLVSHDSQSSASRTQSSSDIIASRCDSFEYLHEEGYNELIKNGDLKRTKSSASLIQSSSSSSNELPVLSRLISQNQSQNLIGDVNKSIELLQKLLKSKKYDETTKKRYVKKIIQKIVNSKYDEDSTSSSEKAGQMQQKLQDNVPWYPAKLGLSVKTFSEEFLPPDDGNNINDSLNRIEPKQKSIFTYSSRQTPSTSDATKNPTDSNSDSIRAVIEQQTSTSSSYNSWKEDKTLSERLLEARTVQQPGDPLVQFAKKERQNQITWIDNEISHLSKLKKLLERRHKQRALQGVRKTTTVYMVQKSNTDSSSTKKMPGRNYVIETELDGVGGSERIDFNFNSPSSGAMRKYQVNTVSDRNKGSDRIVGDIEVVSDQSTTSIKVKTRRLRNDRQDVTFKPKVPVLAGNPRTCPRCCPYRVPPCLDLKEQFAFEVPLQEKRTVLSDQVCEILDKYATNSNKEPLALQKKRTVLSEQACEILNKYATNLNKEQPNKNEAQSYSSSNAERCRCGFKDRKLNAQRPLICLCRNQKRSSSSRSSAEFEATSNQTANQSEVKSGKELSGNDIEEPNKPDTQNKPPKLVEQELPADFKHRDQPSQMKLDPLIDQTASLLEVKSLKDRPSGSTTEESKNDAPMQQTDKPATQNQPPKLVDPKLPADFKRRDEQSQMELDPLIGYGRAVQIDHQTANQPEVKNDKERPGGSAIEESKKHRPRCTCKDTMQQTDESATQNQPLKLVDSKLLTDFKHRDQHSQMEPDSLIGYGRAVQIGRQTANQPEVKSGKERPSGSDIEESRECEPRCTCKDTMQQTDEPSIQNQPLKLVDPKLPADFKRRDQHSQMELDPLIGYGRDVQIGHQTANQPEVKNGKERAGGSANEESKKDGPRCACKDTMQQTDESATQNQPLKLVDPKLPADFKRRDQHSQMELDPLIGYGRDVQIGHQTANQPEVKNGKKRPSGSAIEESRKWDPRCTCKDTMQQTDEPTIQNQPFKLVDPKLPAGFKHRDQHSQMEPDPLIGYGRDVQIGHQTANQPEVKNGKERPSGSAIEESRKCGPRCTCKDTMQQSDEPANQNQPLKLADSKLPADFKHRDQHFQTELDPLIGYDRAQLPKLADPQVQTDLKHRDQHSQMTLDPLIGYDRAQPPKLIDPKVQTDLKHRDQHSQMELDSLVHYDRAVQTDDFNLICRYCNKQTQTCNCQINDEAAQTQPTPTFDHKIQTAEIINAHRKLQTALTTENRNTQTRAPVSSSDALTRSQTESTSSDTETSDTESLRSCSCCKKRNAEVLCSLRKQLSDRSYPLCRPCYRQTRKPSYVPAPYDDPSHICNCYTAVDTRTLDQIKQTIRDLEDVDRHCTCANGSSGRRRNSDCCSYCRCKLKKTSKGKNGIAYVLTLEEATPQKHKKKKEKKKSLEEIKIKVPVAQKKKKKDRENRRKREKEKMENGVTSSMTSETHVAPSHTLQEYLNQNRPDFVEMAEDRRHRVIENKTERLRAKEYRDQLVVQNANIKENPREQRRLFSSRQMREITQKNYQKLPEVQQKLVDNREKYLKEANRLLVDAFNRKLKENVLKGKPSLPLDVNVVNL